MLGERQPDGATLREHYESVQRQTGQTPDLLADAVPCPPELDYLWEYFVRVCARRSSSDYMPNPISNAELEAWARLNRVRLSAFEVDVLDELERIYLSHCAERLAAKAKANG